MYRYFIFVSTLLLMTYVSIVAQNNIHNHTHIENTFPHIHLADTIKVGLTEAPPFINISDKGYSGLCIDLWEDIAEELHIPFQYYQYDLATSFDSLQSGGLDMLVGPITVTAERIDHFSFSLPFFISSLGVTMREDHKFNFTDILVNIFSFAFLELIILLAVVISIAGTLIWFFEHKNHPEDSDRGIKRLSDGIWWSAVTMTTVGYGDKIPHSRAGRIVALAWMFSSILIISSFTASIASTLTVNQMTSNFEGLSSLRTMDEELIGTVQGSSSAEYLANHYVYCTNFYKTALEGLNAVSKKEIDAFVYDESILKHLISAKEYGNVSVLPQTFNIEYYSFMVPKESKLLEKIDRILIKKIMGKPWEKKLREHGLM